MIGPPDPDAYYRAIEEEFVRRRKAPMILSPRDWALMGAWREAGIPLRIVLQGIDNVFEAFESRPHAPARRINSLSYCRQEVLSLHHLHQRLQAVEAGRPAGSGREAAAGVARHLGQLARRVRQAMGAASEARLDPLVAALAGAAADLKRLRSEIKAGSLQPSRLEEELHHLEEGVLDSARRALPEGEVVALEADAARELEGERTRMTPDGFAATRRALVARALRRRCRLPRLTLFD